ncbi:exopolyphosphatase [Echinicola jeungdonensis]|uniref:Exopolyphosphatase n=1 Tax=Echinicola jeungdonensis TaxID=709343 RepID=A0ABV5J2Q0_9BACT|nr:exopolyphosphatase [Echinicola jeungdonensis]MDN3668314.1 exopolyphosphatase [Echinicola jeungdonensis]
MTKEKAAIIDMGTNTFHLLLVELNQNGFQTLYKEKVPVKIGQGGISNDLIHPEAQNRALNALGHFRKLIDKENIKQVYAFATSAVRSAKNGKEFTQFIKDQLDIEVHVINGDQEAELIYEGVQFSGSLEDENSLIMDIGGGSVEFIIGNQHQALWKRSFEIGGQRLLDLFHYHDPILPEEIGRLMGYLDDRLTPLKEAIALYQPKRFVGASGTFDTLTDMYYASVHLSKEKGERVFHLPRIIFEAFAQKLVTLNKAQRLEIPGMIPMRVDMIVVATCLIEYILKFVDADELICSHFALKEGVISKLIKGAQLEVPVYINNSH